MIDHTTENLITPAEAAKRLPSGRPGKRVHIATIHRWFAQGALDSIRIGGRRFTSVEALDRFIARGHQLGPPKPTAALPAKAMASSAAHRAMKELDKLGI